MEKSLKNNELIKAVWTKEFVIFDENISVSHLSKLI